MDGDQRLIVLIASEDAEIYEASRSAFPAEEFRLVRLTDNRDFLKRFYEVLPDVIVMEESMSTVNSVDLCALVRQLVYVPIILISRDPDHAQVVSGLERGADVFVGLGFSRGELMARVKALLRRRSQHWGTIRELLDTSRRTIRAGPATDIRFSPTEFRLLCFMLLSRHKTVSAGRMLGHVWAGKKADTETVQFHLRRLAWKLEQNSDWRIIGRRGSGYRLVVGPQHGLGLMPCSSPIDFLPAH